MPQSDLAYGMLTPPLTPHFEDYEDPVDLYLGDCNVPKIDAEDFLMNEDLVEDVVDNVRTTGGCIIRGLIPQEKLVAIESELVISGMLKKSATFATDIVGNTVWQSVGQRFLTTASRRCWYGHGQRSTMCLPHLSTAMSISILPGSPAQPVHRPDDLHQSFQPAISQHQFGRDNNVCFFVAGKRCTRSNGAMRFVPGSHLWDYSHPPPEDVLDYAFAELQPGDAFMMLG